METLVINMVANKYAFLQITSRRFLNEWEAYKKVISTRNIRRRIPIPQTLCHLKLLRTSDARFSTNAETEVQLVCRLLLEHQNTSHTNTQQWTTPLEHHAYDKTHTTQH